MKKNLKSHLDIIMLNTTGLFIGILFYLYIKQEPQFLIAFVASSISLSFGIRKYNMENDKIFKELFQEFNKKYDDKFNNYFNGEMEKLDTILIIDYINFCSEEYLWYKKGRIPEDVWKSWKIGMEYILKKDNIYPIVLEEKNNRDSYYGMFDELII